MKVSLFSLDVGPESREIEVISSDLAGEASEVTVMSWDSEEAIAVRELYDIYTAPAVLITTDSGSYVELWQGALPSVSEIKYRLSHA